MSCNVKTERARLSLAEVQSCTSYIFHSFSNNYRTHFEMSKQENKTGTLGTEQSFLSICVLFAVQQVHLSKTFLSALKNLFFK